MDEFLVVVDFLRLPISGRQQGEQLAMAFPRTLSIQTGAGPIPLIPSAPKVMKKEPRKGIDIAFEAAPTLKGVKIQEWLGHHSGLDEATESRIFARILIASGEDLGERSFLLRSKGAARYLRGEEEIEHCFPSSDAEWAEAATLLSRQVVHCSPHHEISGLRQGVLQLDTSGTSRHDEASSWQILVYMLLLEEWTTLLLHEVQRGLGRQLSLLQAEANPDLTAQTAEAKHTTSPWSSLILVGKLRHAWALLITQRQEFIDALHEGSAPVRAALSLEDELGVRHKLEAIASVLGAAEQLAAAAGNRQFSPTPEVSTAPDALTAALKSWASDGLGIKDILDRLDTMAGYNRESMMVYKMMLAAVIIMCLVVSASQIISFVTD